MKTFINCYYCDYYNDETDECDLGYFGENDCEEIEEENEEE